MALQPVTRRSVPEEVFEQIATDVLTGEMPPGEALPSERRLAELLGVSRPAVREALKRLSAAGLVEVRQGDVTTVRDFRRHAGLDLLPRLLFRNGELDISVVRSILEARLRNNPIVWQRHTLDFWDHVVDSAGSIVDRLMYNAFRAAYEPTLAALTTTMTAAAKRPSDYRKLADAICSGDPTGAKKAAQDLLELANTSLMAVLVSQASRQ